MPPKWGERNPFYPLTYHYNVDLVVDTDTGWCSSLNVQIQEVIYCKI